MKEIKVTHQTGREYLNEAIVETNRLETQINKLNSNYRNKIDRLENMGKIFRNKCVDMHYMFENITYNGDNSLKNEVFKLYVNYMGKGSSMLQEICAYIVEVFGSEQKTVEKIDELNKKIKEYNEICKYIYNYSLKDNLKELLIERYSRIDPQEVVPRTFVNLYEIDVTTIKELGLYEEYRKYENEIIELVSKKEIICDTYCLQKCKNILVSIKNVFDVPETLKK